MINNKLKELGRKILIFSFKLFEGSGIGKIPIIFRLFLYLQTIFFKSAIVDGQIYYLNNNGPRGTWELYYKGITEPHVTALFCSLIKKGMIVVDIGAFTGYYTLLAAKRVGDIGRVFAFEPVPKHFKVLQRNISINNWNNVKAFQLAISDKNEKRKFNINPTSGSSFANTKSIVDIINVNTVSLDSFLQDNVEPDIIKIDIEGGEFEALKSMKEILARGKAKIICEIHPTQLLSLGYNTKKVEDILKRFNYNIYLINKEKLTLMTSLTNDYAHYLFTKERI